MVGSNCFGGAYVKFNKGSEKSDEVADKRTEEVKMNDNAGVASPERRTDSEAEEGMTQ